jgi:thermitase
MTKLSYYVGNQRKVITFETLADFLDRRQDAGATAPGPAAAPGPARPAFTANFANQKQPADILRGQTEQTLLVTKTRGSATAAIPTESMILDHPRKEDVKWLVDKHGMEKINEFRGIVLLRSPAGGLEGIRQAFDASRAVVSQRGAAVAQPNFIRATPPLQTSRVASHSWHIDNQGSPGIVGADVHALAAWTITEGEPDIVVAVVDEGVSTKHPWLKKAIVSQADFCGIPLKGAPGNSAQPAADDNHGTACAGIIASRHADYRGIAPNVSLSAVRIAERRGGSGWQLLQDFEAAQGIEWAWKVAEASVISCSWDMGDAPAPVVETRVVDATQSGRKGKGTVVVFAAGNQESAVRSPANLPNVLTVGASNQWDERKTRNSQDGETNWGSNFGASLDLIAPGIGIRTTDISGRHGASTGMALDNFNGTSAAAPMVAAAAALILSIRPKMAEAEVRDIIKKSADPLGTNRLPDQLVGYGRLNVYEALRLARRT